MKRLIKHLIKFLFTVLVFSMLLCVPVSAAEHGMTEITTSVKSDNFSLFVKKSKKIKVSKTKIGLKKKQRLPEITWTSSDTSIATVSSKGKIKAIGRGMAVITATIGDENYNLNLYVNAPSYSTNYGNTARRVKKTILMDIGDTKSACVTGFTDGTPVTWYSRKKSVADVDENGNITAFKKGKAKIVAKYGKKKYTFTVKVSRNPAQAHTHEYEEITLYDAADSLKGEKFFICQCGSAYSEFFTNQAVCNTHVWDEGEWVNEPSCLTKGYKKYICTVCGIENYGYTDELGHDYRFERSISSNCVSAQNDIYKCSRCNAEETHATGSPNGHVPGATVSGNRVEPVCTADGSYDDIERCAVCNGILHTTPHIIEKLGHKAGSAVSENVVPATCEDGSYDEVVRCERCNALISLEHKTIPASQPHNFSGNTCTVCGETRYDLGCEGLYTEEGDYVAALEDTGIDISKNISSPETEGLPALLKTEPYSSVKNIILPETDTIGESALNGISDVEIKLSSPIKTIGEKAFYGCDGFDASEIEYTEDADSIGGGAFAKTGTSGDVVVSAKEIGNGAFSDCPDMTSLTISGANTIGMGVISGSDAVKEIVLDGGVYRASSLFVNLPNLEKVTIKNNVDIWGSTLFAGCTKLKDVIISDTDFNGSYGTFMGCTGIKNVTMKHTKSNGNNMFTGISSANFVFEDNALYPNGYANSIVDATDCTFTFRNSPPSSNPMIKGGSGNIIIADAASINRSYVFKDYDSIDEIKVTDKLTVIPDYAFYKNSFKKFLCPNSDVISVGECAFQDCNNLETFECNIANTKTIGYDAFNNCSKMKNSFTFNNAECTIGSRAFYSSGVTGLIFAGKSIGAYAFQSCAKLKHIEINKCDEIGNWAFNRLYDSVTDYLETLTEPVALILKNIKKIGTEAFSGMKAESLEIPETVEYADAPFKQIQGLNSVSINCVVGPEWSGAFNDTDFKEITINRPVSGGSGFHGGLAIYVYHLERMNINANVSSETNSNIFLLHDGYAEKTVINIAEGVTEVGKINVYKYRDPDTGSDRDINYDNYEINFADKNKWTVDGVSVDVDTLDAKKMFLSGKVFVKQQ